MTRRDYVLLSSALAKANALAFSEERKEGVAIAALEIASAIKVDSSRPNGFDVPRFMRDAGVDETRIH